MKKTIIYVAALILVLCSVNAFEILEFDNGYSTENLSYSDEQNYTRYITLQKNSVIFNSIINLTGKINTIDSSECYQENFSQTRECGARNDNGTFGSINNPSIHITGGGTDCSVQGHRFVYNELNTTGRGCYNSGTSNVGYYINYSIPYGATTGSTWSTWEANTVVTNPTDIVQNVITINSSCLNRTDNILQLRWNVSNGNFHKYCKNNINNWILLTVTTKARTFMEEAVVWKINYPYNISLNIANNGTSQFNEAGIFNYTTGYNLSDSIEEKITACNCNDCTSTEETCQVPMNFISNTAGTIEYYSFFINYSLAYNVTLIDERTGQPLDIAKVATAKIYQDNTVYDLKAASTNNIQLNFTSNSTFRLEMNIADGTLINKYFDVSTFSEDDLRICGNPENYTHYEQVILSVSSPIVKLYNSFADCYVTSDYTRFGYATQNSLKAYTVESDYKLFLNSNGTFVELIGIDGTTASSINIDTILFSQRDYNSIIKSDTMHVKKLYGTNTTMEIVYKNFKEDNTGATLTITNLDTNSIIYSSSSFNDFDNITVYYDFVLDTYDNETLWKVELTKTTSLGTSKVTRYFNAAGKTGNMKSELAMVLAVIILIFAFSTLIPDFSLSYIGIIACFGSLVILFNSVPTFYITFMQGITLIIMLFIFTIMFTSKQRTLIT